MLDEKNMSYECYTCNYFTSKKANYDRHMSSDKHKININNLNKMHECDICNKTYANYNSLWRHKDRKHCIINCKTEEKIDKLTDLMFDVVRRNNDLTSQNVKLTQQICKLADSKNTIHCNNNVRFNINFYLNNTCKDAMNISNFADSINVTIKDLEETSRLGFVDGISRIIINNLKEIDNSDRPIHCSDSKRVILYVKNEDAWSKNDNEKIVLLIKNVAGKNIKQIYEWQKLNPDYRNPDSKCSDAYQHMLCQTMIGDTREQCDNNINKIIKNIAKETIIVRNYLDNFDSG